MQEENQPQISKKLLFLNAFLVFSIVCMVFFIYGLINIPVPIHKEPEQVFSSRAFDNLSLQAKSVYVFDLLKNKVLYEKNSLAQLPLASITKLMTALTAVELFPKDTRITIRKEFLEEEGDTGLLSEESWKLKDLLDFSLIVSSNDGARSVASVVGAFNIKSEDYDLGRKDFIHKMNVKAQELGLEQTYFINETGLDEGNVSGGYGSAVDIAKLLGYIIINKPNLLEATKYETAQISSLNKTHSIKNTNDVLNNIPGLIVSKTGYTDFAGGNLVVVFDASMGRPMIVVVLGSSENGRFRDIEELVFAIKNYIQE